MRNSKIEWTDDTWNPVVGCSIVSPGCTNCYAMKMAARIEAMKRSHYDGTTKRVKGNAVWTGKVALAPDHILTHPLRWKEPRRIFVNSMGDLFHESIPDEWIDKVFAVMALSPQHTFQVLTKRAKRMQRYLTNADHHEAMRSGIRSPGFTVVQRIQALVADYIKRGKFQINGFGPIYKEDWDRVKPHLRPLPLPNVWLGVSTERQQEADERIPHLLATPAAVRFISAEPLLGPINLASTKGGTLWIGTQRGCGGMHRGDGSPGCPRTPHHHHDERCGPGLDWVIAGGESGSNARPMHPEWARSLRDQCAAAGVPFFFKQWGKWAEWPAEEFESEEAESLDVQGRYDYWPALPGHPEMHMRRVGKKAAGRLLDGKEHNAMPEVA